MESMFPFVIADLKIMAIIEVILVWYQVVLFLV